MRIYRALVIAFAFLLLHGCATVKPTTLPDTFWKESGKKISVSVSALPTPSSSKLGTQGLLDMAINKAVANEWDGYIKSMVFEPYEDLSDTFVKGLNQRGFVAQAVKIDTTNLPGYSAGPNDGKGPFFEKDLRKLDTLAGSDYALIVVVDAVGTARDYYGFVPLSDPRGYVVGHLALVDVKTDQIKLWKDVVINQGAEKPWDQPPSYPNLSEAIDKAVESSRKSFETALFGDGSAPAPAPVASAAAH